MSDVVIPLTSHELSKVERLAIFREVFTAALLVNAGFAHLHEPGVEVRVLAALDFAVGGAVVLLGLVEMRGGRKFGHRVRWFDVGAGGLLAAEGVHFFVEGHHHWQLGAGYILAGVLTAAAGVFHERIAKRRVLRLDDNGIHFHPNRLRKFRVAWRDVASVSVSDSAITIATTRGGSYAIRRRHAADWEAVRSRVLEHARARGIGVTRAGATTREPPPAARSERHAHDRE